MTDAEIRRLAEAIVTALREPSKEPCCTRQEPTQEPAPRVACVCIDAREKG